MESHLQRALERGDLHSEDRLDDGEEHVGRALLQARNAFHEPEPASMQPRAVTPLCHALYAVLYLARGARRAHLGRSTSFTDRRY